MRRLNELANLIYSIQDFATQVNVHTLHASTHEEKEIQLSVGFNPKNKTIP